MRLPYVSRDELSPEGQQVYDRIAGTRGQVLNVFKALANSPGALETVSRVGEFIRFQSAIDPTVRELCILLVARKTNCIYEWTQHMRVARQIEIPEALLQALRDGTLSSQPGAIGVAARFVEAVVDNDGHVDDDLFDQALSTFGRQVTVELAVLAGYYRLLAGVLNVLKVELEPGVEAVPF